MATITKVSKEELRLALKILNQYRENWAAYERDCEEWAAEGYRPHYCFHGLNLWVDWDPICGMCEEHGNRWNFKAYAMESLYEAGRAVAEKDKRMAMVSELMRMNAPVSVELIEWVMTPVSKYN